MIEDEYFITDDAEIPAFMIKHFDKTYYLVAATVIGGYVTVYQSENRNECHRVAEESCNTALKVVRRLA